MLGVPGAAAVQCLTARSGWSWAPGLQALQLCLLPVCRADFIPVLQLTGYNFLQTALERTPVSQELIDGCMLCLEALNTFILASNSTHFSPGKHLAAPVGTSSFSTNPAGVSTSLVSGAHLATQEGPTALMVPLHPRSEPGVRKPLLFSRLPYSK